MSVGEPRRIFRANERLEAFSDGVFSIVITLLVIELALPHLENPRSAPDLFNALFSMRGRFVSYFICFLFVGQLWVAHTNVFRLIAKVDGVLMWLNILLLMMVCLQPFVTTILGEYPDNPGSVVVFGILFTATSAVFGPMSWYCHIKGLYHPWIDRSHLKRGLRLVSVIEVASVVPLTFAYSSPRLAMLCYVVLIGCYIAVQPQLRIQGSSPDDL